jgi:hypothetical protein
MCMRKHSIKVIACVCACVKVCRYVRVYIRLYACAQEVMPLYVEEEPILRFLCSTHHIISITLLHFTTITTHISNTHTELVHVYSLTSAQLATR